jgi:tetratricopeptide (TPR) repeat protein
MYLDQLLQKAHDKHLRGNLDGAVKLYNEILKLSPDHLDANYLLGTLYAEAGEFDTARRYLEKADSINSASPYIKVNFANVCKALGDFDTARELYRQALALEENLPQALFGLGHIQEIADNDREGALDHYRKAVQLNPNDPAVLQTMGRLLFSQGDRNALDYFRMAAQINPRQPEIFKDLGIACIQFGETAEGANYLRQVLQINRQDAEARHFLDVAEGKAPAATPQ